MKEKEIELYILKNWTDKDLKYMEKETGLSIYEILQIAYENKLHRKKNTEIAGKKRTWTSEEDQFVKDHSSVLNIDEAASLFRRSRQATFQRIKFLGLKDMVQKRNGEKNEI